MHVREISQPSNTTSMPLQDHFQMAEALFTCRLLAHRQHQQQNSVSSGKAKGWQAGNHQFTPQEEKKYMYVLTPLPGPLRREARTAVQANVQNIFPLKYDWLPRIYFPPRRSFIHGYPSHELIHMTFNQRGRMPFATATYK
jgi:hypothetical protein